MATRAKILVNAMVPPQEVPLTWPAATPVQLNNDGLGGESTWTWVILDQPPGAPDNLSAANIENPTITPKKEGTYLIRVTVNSGLGDEKKDTQIFYIRDVKTKLRKPAAGERLERDLVRGWAEATNAYFEQVTNLMADPGRVVGISGSVIGPAPRVLRASSYTTIKTGFPGEEVVPVFTLAHADQDHQVTGPLFMLVGGIDGNTNPPIGVLVGARLYGIARNLPGNAAAAVGDPVFVSNSGDIEWLQPGDAVRSVGHVIGVNGGQMDILFCGYAQQNELSNGSIVWGNTSLPNASGICYLDLGHEDRTAVTANPTGYYICNEREFISRLIVNVMEPADDALVVGITINDLSTDLLVTIPAGSNIEQDFNARHAFVAAPGARIGCLAIAGLGTTQGAGRISVTVARSRR